MSEVLGLMSESQSFYFTISTILLGTPLHGPTLSLFFNQEGEVALRTLLRNGFVP